MVARRMAMVLAAAVLGTGMFGFEAQPVAGQETAVPVMTARRALNETVNELSVDNVSLEKVFTFMRSVSGANIVVNWKVLEGVGVAKDTPITLQVRDLTLRKMMRLVLDQASPTAMLVFNVDSNVIEVTTQDEADRVMVTKVYVVDDLVMPDTRSVTPPTMDLSSVTKSGTTSGGSGSGSGGSGTLFSGTDTGANTTGEDTAEKRGQELVELVREVVRPTIWRENGGTASIRYFSGKLVVTAPVSVHEAIGGPVLPEGGQRFGM